MQRNRLPLHALRAFAVAAGHRNLVKAAEELAVTHGAVSHQIRSLEEQLKTQLFDRKTRPMTLTPAGEQLLLAVEDCLNRLEKTATAIQNGEIEGEVTLSCVPGIASNWLVPSLGEFLSMHTSIAVRIMTEYWQNPTIAEQSDIAVAYGSAEHPGKRVVLLGQSQYFPVCSPLFLETVGPIVHPEQIIEHTLLHEYSDETWMRWFAVVGLVEARIARRVYFDGAHLSLQAARAGYGIAMGDPATVRIDLANGTLVRLFAESVPAAFPYYLIAAPRAEQNAAARALEAWLIQRFPI